MGLEIIPLLISSVGGAVIALGVQWLRSRDTRHDTDMKVNARLEDQRGKLTLDLLQQARHDVAEAKEEAAGLRPMVARLAHFEEALDHLHALLSSETDAERAASERRARAFLRRMRGEEERGDLRNDVQAKISAKRLAEGGTHD